MTGNPDFDCDQRLSRCNLVLPKAGISIPGIVKGTKISCTYRGGQCTSCRLPSSTHRVNDTPVIILLTDEFGPCMLGNDNDCFLVIRINGGSIQQFKDVLNWQEKQGQRIQAGSICILSLVTHVCRVGHDYYWAESRAFAEWGKARGLFVMPTLPPFPSTIKSKHRIELQKVFTHIQLLHYGNSISNKDLRFCLWEPLVLAALETPNIMVDAIPATFRVQEYGEPGLGSVARCNNRFIQGFSNIDGAVTSKVERLYVTHLTDIMRKVVPLIVPGEMTPTVPSIRSINQTIHRDFGENADHDGKTIYLVGNSILGSLEESLLQLAEPAGVEVISLCKSGSYKKVFLKDDINLANEWAPISEGDSSDILVFSVIGNEMLFKKAFYNNGGKCHISQPSMLSDVQAVALVRDVSNMLNTLRTMFSGKIIVLGPTPRHLSECCGQSKHKILDKDGEVVDMCKYTDAVTDYCNKALALPSNVEFIGYKEQFGGEFNESFLGDGVHLDKDAKMNLSCFVMSLLEKEPSLARPAMGNVPSFLALVEQHGVRALGESDMEEEDGV